MRGYITERRPGVWRLTVSDAFNTDGSRRRVTKTVHGSRRDAERALTGLLKDKDEGKLSDGRQHLERFLREEWLPSVSATSKRGRPLAPTTRQRYADSIRHIADHIGRVRLMDLRPRHVEKLRERLLASKLAPQTVGDVLRVLSQALNRAEARGYCRNVAAAALVHRPVGKVRDFEVITAEAGQKILAAVVGLDPWDVAAHLALGLGLRQEEVLGLRWSDVDDVVRVRQALTATADGLHFGPPKSAAGERDVQIPEFVARAIARHKAGQGERLLMLGIRPDLVVDNGIGEPWHPASFSTGWRRFAKARGFEGVTFHGLRHGAASLLLAAGVADKVALDVMGHADTRILRHYQEVADELKKDAAARMDELLGGRS
jgi:integrase